MKTQMRFQKILMIITVLIGALGVVYALFFASGSFAQIQRVSTINSTDINGLENDTGIAAAVLNPAIADIVVCFNLVQSTNDKLLILGIVFVVVSVLPLIAACQKRRKYYVTNYVAIGIVLAMQLIFIIIIAIYVSDCLNAFNKLDFDTTKILYDYYHNASTYGEFSTKPWTATFGFVIIGLVAANMVALVLNLVWKILLMRGEKKLLEQSVNTSTENDNVVAEVV